MARLFNSCIIFVLLITISGCVPDVPDDGDPMESPDVQMLIRLCDVHEVPLATNYKSGHIMVKYFDKK